MVKVVIVSKGVSEVKSHWVVDDTYPVYIQSNHTLLLQTDDEPRGRFAVGVHLLELKRSHAQVGDVSLARDVNDRLDLYFRRTTSPMAGTATLVLHATIRG